MTVQTAAGTKLYIGGVSAAGQTQTEFDAETWVEFSEIEDLGEFGDQANEIQFTALGDRRVRKFKGSFDAGTLSLTVGRDTSDAGQTAIIAALASDSDYNFKIELNDSQGNNGTTFYFEGKVMSYTTNPGNSENVVRSTVNIGINSAIIEKGAA